MTCLFLCDMKGMDRILPGTPVTPTGKHAAFYWAKHGTECIKPLLGFLCHLSCRNDLGGCGETGDFLREGAWRDQTPGILSSPEMRNWNTVCRGKQLCNLQFTPERQDRCLALTWETYVINQNGKGGSWENHEIKIYTLGGLFQSS